MSTQMLLSMCFVATVLTTSSRTSSAATFSYDSETRTLTITGTSRVDHIDVRLINDDKTVEFRVQGGPSKTYQRNRLALIKFLGGSGNDYFRNETSVRLIARGGNGDDYLRGGSAKDNINGENDDDTIHGRGGDDMIWGGSGHDTIYGYSGNDTLRGDDGNDFISGGSGNDKIAGHAGNDELHAGTGADEIGGGSGRNDLYVDASDWLADVTSIGWAINKSRGAGSSGQFFTEEYFCEDGCYLYDFGWHPTSEIRAYARAIKQTDTSILFYGELDPDWDGGARISGRLMIDQLPIGTKVHMDNRDTTVARGAEFDSELRKELMVQMDRLDAESETVANRWEHIEEMLRILRDHPVSELEAEAAAGVEQRSDVEKGN